MTPERWLERLARWRASSIGLAFLTVSGSAMAQVGLGNPSLEEPSLPQADLDRMHAAVSRLYESRAVGSTEMWNGTVSGTSGEVRLARVFDYKNMPCRTIDYAIRTAGQSGPNRFVLNWCQVPGGSWKIVQVPTSR